MRSDVGTQTAWLHSPSKDTGLNRRKKRLMSPSCSTATSDIYRNRPSSTRLSCGQHTGSEGRKLNSSHKSPDVVEGFEIPTISVFIFITHSLCARLEFHPHLFHPNKKPPIRANLTQYWPSYQYCIDNRVKRQKISTAFNHPHFSCQPQLRIKCHLLDPPCQAARTE